MNHSTLRVFPAVAADAEILCRWIMPSEILPEGQAGFVRVNEAVYMLLPLADRGQLVGWRFTKSDGKVYDVDCAKAAWTCDCPDAQYRHRSCKHVAALRMILAVDKVIRERAEAAANDAWPCRCRSAAQHAAECGTGDSGSWPDFDMM